MSKVNKQYKFSSYFQSDFPFFIDRFSHTNRDCNKSIVCKRDFWKIIYILKGDGSKIINHEAFPVKQGTLFVVHPEDQTAFDITSKQLDIYNILFLPGLITREVKELSNDFNFFSIFQDSFRPNIDRKIREQLYVLDSNREIGALIKRMLKEYQLRSSNYRVVLKLQLLELLALICRLSSKKVKHGDSGVVEYLKYIVDENYMESIDLYELAKHTGISQSHMCRLFRAKTDTTISDYLRKKRLSSACTFLKDSKLSISEICYACGFNDLSYFYKVFKKECGQSPGKYRKLYGFH